jgi:hypothetical protein
MYTFTARPKGTKAGAIMPVGDTVAETIRSARALFGSVALDVIHLDSGDLVATYYADVNVDAIASTEV